MRLNTIAEYRQLVRQKHYTHYTSVGSYPLFYGIEDSCFCPNCALKDCRREMIEAISQNKTVWSDINWEDTNLYCDNCNNPIEAAYTDD